MHRHDRSGAQQAAHFHRVAHIQTGGGDDAYGGGLVVDLSLIHISAVTDGDRLLMTRYADRPVTWFVLVAGFVEIGEAAEETVRREVLEETGLRVKNVRYFGSQPWGCAGNLTLGYWAELDGDDAVTLEERELAEARWFDRTEVPVMDDNTSLTSAMVRAFAEGKEREYHGG